jgi:hypothetical protein
MHQVLHTLYIRYISPYIYIQYMLYMKRERAHHSSGTTLSLSLSLSLYYYSLFLSIRVFLYTIIYIRRERARTIYIFIYIYIYIYVYIYKHIYIYINIHTSVCMCMWLLCHPHSYICFPQFVSAYAASQPRDLRPVCVIICTCSACTFVLVTVRSISFEVY